MTTCFLVDSRFCHLSQSFWISSRGVQHLWHTARNEAIAIGGKGRLITSLYLQKSVWNCWTSCPIPWFHLFSVPVRFSQSAFLPMSPDETVVSYFIGNWAASELLEALSKGVERVPSHRSSLQIFQSCLSALTELFVHVWCIPHQ